MQFHSKKTKLIRPTALALCGVLAVACVPANKSVEPSGQKVAMSAMGEPELSPGVFGRLYLPQGTVNAPGVLVLHGQSGIYDAYDTMAKTLQAQGYAALLLDYYSDTGKPGHTFDRERIRRDWDSYLATIQRAGTYLRGLPNVSDDGMGLVGFSLGGFLAVEASGQDTSVRAVVEYYGGARSNEAGGNLDAYVDRLPPLLILHGGADSFVDVSRGQELYEAVTAAGRIVEMKVYPGVEHCFNCALKSNSSAARDAQARTIAFLNEHLAGSR